MRFRSGRAAAVFAAGLVLGAVAGVLATRSSDDAREPHVRQQRVYTLRSGDAIVRPEAAVRCEASAEAGRPNLFCERTRRGVHQVIFYAECLLVWPLARGPDGPPFAYRWARDRPCR